MSTIARISIAEYDRMVAAGVFEPSERHRIELICGELRNMNPINPPHEEALDFLMYWSIDNTPRDQVRVRNQNSLGLTELESVPEPDLFWVRKKDYSLVRPVADDVLLVIEVSDSSLSYDRGEKAELYAQANIQDYWIVNTRDRVVEVYRDPAGNRYRQMQTFAIGDSLSPLALPDLQLAIANLWPPK